MKDETYFKIGLFSLLIIAIVLGVLILNLEDQSPVGLFVVRPDTEFFRCAVLVHGDYDFYYNSGLEEFVFIRDKQLCYVNTVQFREKYIKMYGKTNEIFINNENKKDLP